MNNQTDKFVDCMITTSALVISQEATVHLNWYKFGFGDSFIQKD